MAGDAFVKSKFTQGELNPAQSSAVLSLDVCAALRQPTRDVPAALMDIVVPHCIYPSLQDLNMEGPDENGFQRHPEVHGRPTVKPVFAQHLIAYRSRNNRVSTHKFFLSPISNILATCHYHDISFRSSVWALHRRHIQQELNLLLLDADIHVHSVNT